MWALVGAIVVAAGVLVWQVVGGGGGDDSGSSVPVHTSQDTTASTGPPPLATNPPTTAVPMTAAPTTSTPLAPPGPAPVVFASRCESTLYGWDVGVPEGWFTEEVNEVWACSGFDRAPVVIDDDSEVIFPLAIWLIEANAADVLAGYHEGSFAEVVSDATTSAGGHDAYRLETLAGYESPLEQGTPGIAVVIDRGGSSTVVIEGFGWTDAEYAEVVAIVDAMTTDIQFSDP